MTHPILRVVDIEAGFSGRAVLHGVSLEAHRGHVVAVLGLNGAGKSVLGRTISGVVPVMRGKVFLAGRDVTRASPRARVRMGLHHLSQRRGLVPGLSVTDNLRLAAYASGRRFDDAAVAGNEAIAARAHQTAGTLSGGEQALVALARAELASPEVLIADEPTAGLSPAATGAHAGSLRRMADAGTCVVLIEQNVRFALDLADQVVVLRSGSVTLDGAAGAVTPDALSAALIG